jgi:hypothetical protein
MILEGFGFVNLFGNFFPIAVRGSRCRAAARHQGRRARQLASRRLPVTARA